MSAGGSQDTLGSSASNRTKGKGRQEQYEETDDEGQEGDRVRDPSITIPIPAGLAAFAGPSSPPEEIYGYRLEIVQQPIRARMCGFGDRDRRPITPPLIVRLFVYDLHTHREIHAEDVEISFFVMTADLWAADRSRELNIVMHSSPMNLPGPRQKKQGESRGSTEALQGSVSYQAGPSLSSYGIHGSGRPLLGPLESPLGGMSGGPSNLSSGALPQFQSTLGGGGSPHGHVVPSAYLDTPAPPPTFQAYSRAHTSSPAISGQYPAFGGISPGNPSVPTRDTSQDPSPSGPPFYTRASDYAFPAFESDYLTLGESQLLPSPSRPGGFGSGQLPVSQFLPGPTELTPSGMIRPATSPGALYPPNVSTVIRRRDDQGGSGTASETLYFRNLVGGLASSAHKLRDTGNDLGIYFILHDLSVRTEGRFCLRLNFTSLGSGNTLNETQASVLATVFSDPFEVYAAKKFPGMVDPTPLSRAFARQGVRIPNRRGPQKRRHPETADVAERDEEEEEDVELEEGQ